jgi:hypothetical protein
VIALNLPVKKGEIQPTIEYFMFNKIPKIRAQLQLSKMLCMKHDQSHILLHSEISELKKRKRALRQGKGRIYNILCKALLSQYLVVN